MKGTWQNKLGYAVACAAYQSPINENDFDIETTDFRGLTPNRDRAVIVATNSDDENAKELIACFGRPERIVEIVNSLLENPTIKQMFEKVEAQKKRRREAMAELISKLPPELADEIIEAMKEKCSEEDEKPSKGNA